MRAVAAQMDAVGHRCVGLDEMLVLCHNAGPSTLGPHCSHFSQICPLTKTCTSVKNGGKLFELFLDTMASWSSAKTWEAHKRAVVVAGADFFLEDEQMAKIVNREKGPFMGFVLLGTNNVARKRGKQVFFNTLLARFHGLSRTGVDTLAHYGFMMKLRTYDRMEAEIMGKHRETIRLAIDMSSLHFSFRAI